MMFLMRILEALLAGGVIVAALSVWRLRSPSQSRSWRADLKAVAMPVVPIAALIACIAIMAKWGLRVGMGFWFSFVATVLLWGVEQRRRALGEKCAARLSELAARFSR